LEQPIIIVGGGLGGLAAAIQLAARGRRVVLLEKNERVGGKLNFVSEAGYTFDTVRLDANGSQFVTAASLSSTQIQLRCNNICFNDCSVTFGLASMKVMSRMIRQSGIVNLAY